MSLREDAIRAYQQKVADQEAKEAIERNEYLGRRIKRAKEVILAAFALTDLPSLNFAHNETSYWPEMTFEVDGVLFDYDLENDWLRVKVSCPKCGGEWMRRFRVPVGSNGVRDLTWLGNELSMPTDPERHFCPADQPPSAPRPDPPSPPQTVTYRLNSPEYRILEAFQDLMLDAIEQEREGR